MKSLNIQIEIMSVLLIVWCRCLFPMSDIPVGIYMVYILYYLPPCVQCASEQDWKYTYVHMRHHTLRFFIPTTLILNLNDKMDKFGYPISAPFDTG